MKDIVLTENTFVMCRDPLSNLATESIEQAIGKIETESELATLFAAVENKMWWIEDETYDFNEETEEYKKIKQKIDLWFALADKLRNRIFDILRTEGIEIPDTKQISVLEPFMKRNGFKDGQGWWIKV